MWLPKWPNDPENLLLLIYDRRPLLDWSHDILDGIYQMMAYGIAADLPSGLLIYAGGEDEHAEYPINYAVKIIEIATLELSGTPEEIVGDVGRLAERICDHTGLLREGTGKLAVDVRR